MQPILHAKHISKSFFGVSVLKNVDFEVQAGEIMGLIGENGAGKSTLMKILTGLYSLESGEILFNGESVRFADSKQAIEKGVSIIHQELSLFDNLTVAENIFLDHKDYRSKLGIVDWKKMNEAARKVLDELGTDFDVTTLVGSLSVREQQLVEIAKAMSKNAKVLIMDEPSAALPENEVRYMFDMVRQLKEKGVAIVYISHRMMEIEEICDRITILRDGENVGVINIKESTINDAIELMVGRNIENYYPHTKREKGSPYLEIKNLHGSGMRDLNLTVRKGEVLGLYGLAGAGSTELVEMVMGLRRRDSGTVLIDGKSVKASIQEVMGAGVGYVPPDRRREGLVVRISIEDNVILANLPTYVKGGLLNRKKTKEHTQKHIDALSLKCTGPDQITQSLSGGNQQKVALSKWLDRNPRVLILNEPTRGVDVGAKSEIYKLIDSLANEGLAILMVSSELPEILGICDQIVVLSRGVITGEYENEDLSQEMLLAAASEIGGVKVDQ